VALSNPFKLFRRSQHPTKQACHSGLRRDLVSHLSSSARGIVLEFPSGRRIINERRHNPYFEFQHVSKSFGATRVLDDVSFVVRPGETMCLLGRSGVGKSVSLRLMMGFLKPDSGKVIAARQDISNCTEDELEHIWRKMTMVFQSGALFDSLTIRGNIAFPLEQRGLEPEQIDRLIDEILDLVGIRQLENFLPGDIPTGYKRAAAIARALASQPESVLYDEPTTMVDPLMARRLANIIDRLRSELKLTSVVVTHDMRLVEKLAGHVIFLEERKVIFDGSAAEMEHSPHPVVREFVELDRFDFFAMLRILDRRSGTHR
jgi:phospholipid/cholesterol/gamma-HCH transport system ATP-binding protein